MTNNNHNFESVMDNKKQVTFGNGQQEISHGRGTKLLNLVEFNKINPIQVQDTHSCVTVHICIVKMCARHTVCMWYGKNFLKK